MNYSLTVVNDQNWSASRNSHSNPNEASRVHVLGYTEDGVVFVSIETIYIYDSVLRLRLFGKPWIIVGTALELISNIVYDKL